MPKLPFIGKKKKPEEDSAIQITIQKKGQKPPPVEAVIRPDIYRNEVELLEGLKGKKDGKFQEPRSTGIKSRADERWDSERLRGLLLNTEDRDKLRLLTVTRKIEFNAIVTAETFDEIAAKGEDRNISDESFVKLFLRFRDMRAPSCFPEEGDSRKELVKMQEIMIAEEERTREVLRIGGSP